MGKSNSLESKSWLILYLLLFICFCSYTFYLYDYSLTHVEEWSSLVNQWVYWTLSAFAILIWILCFIGQLGQVGEKVSSFSRLIGTYYARISEKIGLPVISIWLLILCWSMVKDPQPLNYFPFILLSLLAIYSYLRRDSFFKRVIYVNLSLPLVLGTFIVEFFSL